MEDLTKNLEYLDLYLNPNAGNDEYLRAFTEAFAGETGKFKGLDYNSNNFKSETVSIFDTHLAPYFEGVGFNEIVFKNKGLLRMLERVGMDCVLEIAKSIKQISPEAWANGERGELAKNYETLKSRYVQFRETLNLAEVA